MQQRRRLLARYHGEIERADEQLALGEREAVERATEQWEAQMLSRLGDAELVAVQEVIAALRRLDEGSYGTCTGCGERIEAARLDALPTATKCIACEEQKSTRRIRKIREPVAHK